MTGEFDFEARRAARAAETAEKLRGDAVQQEFRADRARKLADAVTLDTGKRGVDVEISVVAERVILKRANKKLEIEVNPDGTFSVDRGPSSNPAAIAARLKEGQLATHSVIDLIDDWLKAN